MNSSELGEIWRREVSLVVDKKIVLRNLCKFNIFKDIPEVQGSEELAPHGSC